MTVDELMQLLEEIPYFTEVAMSVRDHAGIPRCAPITGIGHFNPHHGLTYKPPEKVYLFSIESLQPLPGKIWVPVFTSKTDPQQVD